jgi:hypothetical protein
LEQGRTGWYTSVFDGFAGLWLRCSITWFGCRACSFGGDGARRFTHKSNLTLFEICS